MKLLHTTVLLICLLVIKANCQLPPKRFEGGLQVGTNYHTLKPGELGALQYPYNEKYKWNLSSTFGGFLHFNINQNLFVESGIQFISTKFNPVGRKFVHSDRSSYTDDINGNVYIINYYESWEHSSNAFQIPLKLHLKIFPSKKPNIDFHIGFFRETNSNFKYKLSTSEETNFEIIPEKILKVLRTRYTPTKGLENHSGVLTKSNEGVEIGASLNYNKFSLDIAYNSPFRVYNQNTIYKVPMIISNLKYKIF